MSAIKIKIQQQYSQNSIAVREFQKKKVDFIKTRTKRSFLMYKYKMIMTIMIILSRKMHNELSMCVLEKEPHRTSS